MTTFTTPTTIPFHPLLLFQKSKISPPFFIHLYLLMRPHGRPMGMVLANYHIISYHIIYPTASTDRSSDYTNEANAPPSNTFSFSSPFMGGGIDQPFSLRAWGQHEALEDTKKHTGLGLTCIYPRKRKGLEPTTGRKR